MTEFLAAALGTATAPPRAVAEPPLILVGGSAALERLRRSVLRLASIDEPVLIHGEAGAGKSLAARMVHDLAPHAHQPCAVVACHAIPETLLHVELFGCAKGSVAGATRDRAGVFEMARGGTVILENVEAMNPGLQTVLARFLATGCVQAVGTTGPGLPVNTRIVATSRSTHGHELSPRLHPDLRAMLSVRLLRVPALRERQADIPALAQFFANEHGPAGRVAFSPDAMRALAAYPWPGNVGQLRSVVQRLVAATGTAEIQAGELPVGIRPRFRASSGGTRARRTVGEELFAHVRSSGASFWQAVYPLFMKREITRADLRDIVRRAGEAGRGDAEAMVRVLNMPGSDRPRFLRFLRKYGCELAL